MLQQTDNYQDLIENFRWDIPEFYNIAVDVCDKWAALEPERLALIHVHQKTGNTYKSKRFSFLDIQQLSNQTANVFKTFGVGVGDRVGVLLPQAPETAYSHLAAYKVGAISVPLFTLFGIEALQFRVGNAAIKAIVTDNEGVEKLASIAAELPELETVFSIEAIKQDEHEYAFKVVEFHNEQQKHSNDFQVFKTKANDPAFLIYTSGTTGPPKGALHAHRSLLGHLPGVEMSHNFFQEDDLFWTPADWAWIGGLFDVLMPAWQHGLPL